MVADDWKILDYEVLSRIIIMAEFFDCGGYLAKMDVTPGNPNAFQFFWLICKMYTLEFHFKELDDAICVYYNTAQLLISRQWI